MSKSKLYILSGNTITECAVLEGINIEWHRKGMPGKMTFNVFKDAALSFEEGNAVRFEYDGHKMFFGFVFTKKRKDLITITVTVYDQLRYFKNKETYVYTNKTATQVLQMIANDFSLQIGSLDNTKHIIPSRVEDDKELFTIVDNALVLTSGNTKEQYVYYDDFGKLTLKNVKDMRLDLLIDESSGEAFDYTTSIDEGTYNRIKLVRENKESGKREVFVAQSTQTINLWGILQYTENLDEGENGKSKANELLAQLNKKSRKLHINKVFGDVRVRGGSVIGVQIGLGDLNVANFMLVETVKHTFNDNDHRMDLNLVGGEFSA